MTVLIRKKNSKRKSPNKRIYIALSHLMMEDIILLLIIFLLAQKVKLWRLNNTKEDKK